MSTERLAAALADRYRVERHLGAGGMATVYLAHDVKHDRKVALKVLKPELAAVLGAERFVVEIRTTASLSHPHILPLFDSGTADGFLFYVMPYVDGETLRDRLNRETQLGVDDAVRIAVEVADALDYAHRHGVIHRDIKPENILLHDGRPMVADFGIALAVSAAAGGRMTETGLSLGTPHYMSPEQATADKEITARSDVYSLGSVLYEMLTGQPPHLGGSAQQIIMKIIADEARPVTELRRSVPPHVAAAVAKALEKLPADRFESARAFRDALTTPTFTHGITARAGAAPGNAGRSRYAVWMAWGAAATFAAVAVLGWSRRTPAPPPASFEISLGEIDPFPRDIVISPDGSMLAVAGLVNNARAIYLRRLDGDPTFTKIAGTEGGTMPTFSPDSKWLAFRRNTTRTLVKIPIEGGAATTIVAAGAVEPYAPHWGSDEHIVFSSPQGNYRVPAGGGTPELLEKVAGRTPFLLPDGRALLLSAGELALYEFASDSTYQLGISGSHPTLFGSENLLYVGPDGGLYVTRFDRRGRRARGTPLKLADRVASTSLARGYAVSRNGTLLLSDDFAAEVMGASGNRLVLGTLGGTTDTLRLPPGRRQAPRFSPDGRSVVFQERRAGTSDSDIVTFDLVSGTITRLTQAGDNTDPVWSPDGKHILFRGRNTSDTFFDLFTVPSDGGAAAQLLLARPGSQSPAAWPREDLIVFHERQTTDVDLLMLTTTDSSVKPYLAAPWNEQYLSLSRDGLAAFISSENGPDEVVVREFPVPQNTWRLSGRNARRARPVWSPDGQYLYFTAVGSTTVDSLLRVAVRRTPDVSFGSPEVMFMAPIDGIQNWDLHPDGKRFVASVPERAAAAEGRPGRFLITLNWQEELRRRLAAQR